MVSRSSVILSACTVVVAVVLSAGASLGVTSLASDHSPIVGATGISGATGKAGVAGKTGSDGTNGADGTDGTTGAAGTDGAVGATGATGATGAQGPVGPAGPAGPAGTSGTVAVEFTATAPDSYSPGGNGNPYTFPAQTALVPAGPALVGFSLGLASGLTQGVVTCSLVDANDPSTIIATAPAPAQPGAGSLPLFTVSQNVVLATATSLTIRCTSTGIPVSLSYAGLSIYAYSFAS
jgi:hypothetical protein